MPLAARIYSGRISVLGQLRGSTICLQGKSVQHGCANHTSPLTRSYTNLSKGWNFSRVQYTKYRIAKPWTSDSEFDDILLAQPSREDFIKYTKELPLFLRFLKLITDVENRPQAFIDFAKRCEGGLVVEKDVFITKKELMDSAWKNGFSLNEINAFEIAFPADYKFHYPELAALFNLSEEECYKYCLRQRAQTPEELVELKYKKPQNLLSSYGLAFLGVWYGFSNQVLSNAWFYSKTFPFGAVFYMLASYFYRNIREFFWKEEMSLVESSKSRKEREEDLLCQQLKRYSNDTKCLDYLNEFKSDIQVQLSDYYGALTQHLQAEMVKRLNGKLAAIQQAEKSIQSSLQNVIVSAIAESYFEKFKTSTEEQNKAFKSAIECISGASTMDPVGAFFLSSLKEIGAADLQAVKADTQGTVLHRVSSVFKAKEKEFLDSFTVRPEETQEIVKLAAKCKKTDGVYDVLSLSDSERLKLEELSDKICTRVGIGPLNELRMETLKEYSAGAAPMVKTMNEEVALNRQRATCLRLSNFLRSFAQ